MLKNDNTSIDAITWLLQGGEVATPRKYELRPMSITHPNLVLEFDLVKNAPKTPDNTPAGTNTKLWWGCLVCSHSWLATGTSRIYMKTGCPACKGFALHSDGRNSMAQTHPKLASEFDTHRNSPRTPANTLAGIHKKMWWICGVCQHNWQAKGNDRSVSDSGCPCCSGRAVNSRTGENCLAKRHPVIALDFDVSKNYPRTPHNTVFGTQHTIWWLCHVCRHSWQTHGAVRTHSGHGCPACANKAVNNFDGRNSMAQTHAHLILEFDFTKNHPKTPENLTGGTGHLLWWKCCVCTHQWQATGGSRIDRRRGIKADTNGCPACANQCINNSDARNTLRVTHPQLASEFDAQKNYPKTIDNLTAGSFFSLWWRCCTCQHSWRTTGANRSGGSGCPACQNLEVNNFDARNSMSKTHPHMALDFDCGKNATRTPDNTVAGTCMMIWWACQKCRHSWRTSGNSRVNKQTGCPACSNKQVNNFDLQNCIGLTHPQISLEMHPTWNGACNPQNLVAGSHRKLWWVCHVCSNTWQAACKARAITGTGCPKCNSSYTAAEHLSNTFLYLALPKTYHVEIDPKTSFIPNRYGRPFQIDARIYKSDELLVAYLYDGGGGHQNTPKSIGNDTARRTDLCQHVPTVLAHRHGMSGLTVPCTNYHEIISARNSPILSGVVASVRFLVGETPNVDLGVWFDLATRTWSSNPLKITGAIHRERKAITKYHGQITTTQTL